MGIRKRSMENLVDRGLFKSVYSGRKVLVTGHTGFKGSWLALWLKMMGAEVTGFALKPDTVPSHYGLLNLKIKSIEGDIGDGRIVKEAIQEVNPEIVFHLAAQPLVRRSYRQAVYTYQTNLMGTLNLYEACAQCEAVKTIISVTSDKVYENKEVYEPYQELDTLGGYDMYSSSKACVELMTNSFRQSFLKNGDGYTKQLVTARAGNVIGGGDWAEDRLVPDIMRTLGRGNPVLIRNPHSVRPWQHLLEPLSGYLLLGQKLFEGVVLEKESWNFGPTNEAYFTVLEMIDMMKRVFPEVEYTTSDKAQDLHESGILAVDSSNAQKILGWRPVWDTAKAITKTGEWYKKQMSKGELLTSSDIQEYVLDAIGMELIWTKQ